MDRIDEHKVKAELKREIVSFYQQSGELFEGRVMDKMSLEELKEIRDALDKVRILIAGGIKKYI